MARALETFLAVVAGGVVAVASNYVVHRMQLERDREDRRERRRDAERDRKRAALLELQDAALGLQDEATAHAIRAIEGTVDPDATLEVYNFRSRVEMLIARVGDDAAAKAAREPVPVLWTQSSPCLSDRRAAPTRPPHRFDR